MSVIVSELARGGLRWLLVGAVVCLSNPPWAVAQPRIQRLIQRFEQRQSQLQPQQTALPEVDGLDPWLRRLHELVPQSGSSYATFEVNQLIEAASAVESWFFEWNRIATGRPVEEQLAIVGRLHDVKSSIDRQLDNVLSLRVEFAALPNNDQRHEALRRYLRTASALIDLSGRLRYLLVDVIDAAAFRVASQPSARDQLIDLLAEKQSSIGAQEMAAALFDPSARDPESPPSLSFAQKIKLIKVIGASGNIELVDDLAEFLLLANTPPALVLAAAEAICELGLPQDPRPGQDASLPQAAITAKQLHDRVAQIDPSRWNAAEKARVGELVLWLTGRSQKGLESDTYRLGSFEVRPGDWLLMRNPSPYNLFTDLSPGLFTHVGVAALETGSDGKRLKVIVDLPERGATMPATNVETFLDRTRHYVFVRHPDPAVGRKMGEAAVEMIGNPTEFDLNFRTDRISKLKDIAIKGQKIHTYCAGFLLLCAEQTGLSRETFFPITETTASGHTKENLAKLGLSLGEGFVSPTGALFSPKLEIVGRSEPMYDARREVEEAVYDHFALGMEQKVLQTSPDAFQSLRLKVAEASKNNPLLAKALAASVGVSEDMDLVSAAKAAAVVETLDEIAVGASDEYLSTREAILVGVPQQTGERQVSATERDEAMRLRNLHANFVARWESRQISPRQLRIELVKYYSQRGCQQIDQRFFSSGR